MGANILTIQLYSGVSEKLCISVSSQKLVSDSPEISCLLTSHLEHIKDHARAITDKNFGNVYDPANSRAGGIF